MRVCVQLSAHDFLGRLVSAGFSTRQTNGLMDIVPASIMQYRPRRTHYKYSDDDDDDDDRNERSRTVRSYGFRLVFDPCTQVSKQIICLPLALQ